MTPPKYHIEALSSVFVSSFKGLIMLSLCAGEPAAELGTTPKIKEIVMGRCYDYITLVKPGLRYGGEKETRTVSVLSAGSDLLASLLRGGQSTNPSWPTAEAGC